MEPTELLRDAKTDNVICLLIDRLYNEGDYTRFDLKECLKVSGFTFNDRDYNLFKQEIKETLFVVFEQRPETLYPSNIMHLSDFGIRTLKEHKSYFNYKIYLLEEEAKRKKQREEAAAEKERKRIKEEREKRLESWPKRNWIIVAVVAYVAGITSPIIVEYSKRKILPEPSQSAQPIQERKDTALKQGTSSYSTGNDSLNK